MKKRQSFAECSSPYVIFYEIPDTVRHSDTQRLGGGAKEARKRKSQLTATVHKSEDTGLFQPKSLPSWLVCGPQREAGVTAEGVGRQGGRGEVTGASFCLNLYTARSENSVSPAVPARHTS